MTVKARIQPGDGDPRHGTMNGYANLGCRCEPCRAAIIAYLKERRIAPCANGCGRQVWGRYRPGAMCRECRAAAQTVKEHGTERAYRRCLKRPGGACAECRAAAAEARRRRRHADLEATRAYDRARYHGTHGRRVAL